MSYQEINKFTRAVTKGMGWRQRGEVKRELRAHIMDSAEALAAERKVPMDDLIVSEVIRRMGPPEEIAAIYPSNGKNMLSDRLFVLGMAVIVAITIIFIGIFILIAILTLSP